MLTSTHLRNKTCFPCLHSLVWDNSRALMRSVKTRNAVEGFHLLENSHKPCRCFQQAMEARITCFISFIKLLFSVLTKRKTIYEAHTVNSYNSEPQSTTLLPSFLCFITLWKHTCRPIKIILLYILFLIDSQWIHVLSTRSKYS